MSYFNGKKILAAVQSVPTSATAETTTYDNTKSGLAAENVQDAINETLTINEQNKKEIKSDLTDLKEALYGYVLDTTNVEIESTIPSTTTIDSTTYNLVDNVRGLVKEIKGNTIKTTNLLNISNVSSTTNGITYSINNGVFTANGTSTTTCFIAQKTIKYPSGTYRLFAFGGNSNCYLQFIENGNFHNIYEGNTQTFTLTQETECIIRFVVDSGITLTNMIIKPMLINGTSTPTIFEPYFEGLKSVEYRGLTINGANLFDKDTATIGYHIAHYPSVNFGKLFGDNNKFVSDYIQVKPNTNYVCKFSMANTGLFSLWKYNANKELIDNVVGSACDLGNAQGTKTFTIEEGTSYIRIVGSINDINNTILNEGTILLPYTPYKAQTTILNTLGTHTLNGVNDAKDKIVITKNEDNDYYTATKISNVGSVDLGTLDYEYFEGGHFISSAINVKAKTINLLCPIYTAHTEDNWLDDVNMAIGVNDSGKLVINNLTYTDITTFKNAMSGVMLYYETETPTETILSTTLTENDVMPLLELGGSVDIINSNSDFVNGSTTMEMVYKLINTTTTSEV